MEQQFTRNVEDLNDKQEMFCQEYLIDSNKKRAAIAAGYSPHSAASIGNKLLSNDKIKDRLSQLKVEILKRINICGG